MKIDLFSFDPTELLKVVNY